MLLRVLGSGGSEGIPCPLCRCRVCLSGEKRLRSSYLLRFNSRLSFLIEASPDIREQILTYAFDFNYCFISHPHFDHINGVHELKQIFILNKDFVSSRRKKRTLIIGTSLYEFLKTGYQKDSVWAESFKESFFDLLDRGAFTMRVLEPYRFYRISSFEILLLLNLHGSHISQGFVLKHGKKSVAYLSDVGVMDRATVEYLRDLKPDLTIVHTPYVIAGFSSKHIGINNLEDILESRRVLISHFSHRSGLTHKEIVLKAREFSEKIIVAYDGLELSI